MFYFLLVVKLCELLNKKYIYLYMCFSLGDIVLLDFNKIKIYVCIVWNLKVINLLKIYFIILICYFRNDIFC